MTAPKVKITKKTKEVVQTAKELRKASFHFCDDVLSASANMKELILEAQANRKIKQPSKTWKRIISGMLDYIRYVEFEMRQLKGATAAEKEKIRKLLSSCKTEEK